MSLAQVRGNARVCGKAQIDSSWVPLLYPSPGTGNGVIRQGLPLVHVIVHVCVCVCLCLTGIPETLDLPLWEFLVLLQ